MAKEKIEDVSTEKLLRRRKVFSFLQGLYLGIAVVVVTLTFFDLIKGREFDTNLAVLGVIILSSIWLPWMILRRIRVELKRRADLE